MIRALLFDYGSTLDGADHWLDRYLGYYQAAGVEIAREQLDFAYTAATRAGYHARDTLECANLTRLNWFLVGKQIDFLRSAEAPPQVRSQMEELGMNGRTMMRVRIVEAMVDESTRAMAASRAILERLAPRFKLGVVSNFYGNLETVLEEAGIRMMLAAVVDSSRVGSFKPDPRIFSLALEGLGTSSAETAMIGDSLDKDIRPAAALGMRTAWYCPRETRVAGPDDVLRIRSLEELDSIEW